MKQLSDTARSVFEPRCYTPRANNTTSQAMARQEETKGFANGECKIEKIEIRKIFFHKIIKVISIMTIFRQVTSQIKLFVNQQTLLDRKDGLILVYAESESEQCKQDVQTINQYQLDGNRKLHSPLPTTYNETMKIAHT